MTLSLCLACLVAPAEQPAWVTSTIGEPAADWVPAPYHPVAVRQAAGTTTLEVVGRRITLAASGLPQQLESAGADLLTAPVAVVAVADQPLTWQWAELRLGERSPRAATWTATGTAAGWTLVLGGRVEYDGLLRYDVTLTPPAGGGLLSRLAWDVPLRGDRARYFSYWPGKWGTAANSGPLAAAGLALGFKPLLWVGDEDRGLSFCAESDQGWQPTADRALTVGPAATPTLTAHLIDQPTTLREPWRTQVMLHPTPLKPLPADPHHLRINHGGAYGLDTTPWSGPAFQLTYDAAKVLDARAGTLELQVTPGFDPQRPLSAAEQAGRGAFNRELVKVRLASGDEVGFYWNIDDRGMRFYCRRGQQHPLVAGAPNGWKQGETHHLALTWGDAVRIWVDGRQVLEKPFAGLCGQPVDLAGATLQVGGDTATFAVHSLRIESRARTSFHPEEAPTTTPQTMLLEVGDQLGSHGTRVGGLWRRGRFGQCLAGYDAAQGPQTALDGLKAAGVRTLVFHEHWTDIQDYGVTPYGDQLRALAKGCHDRGLKLLVYFGYEMSDRAPEWDRWHESCLVAPRAGGYQRQPPQTAYIVCYHSPWRNFLIEQIAHAVDAYGVDGVYLDGTIEPFACANEQHGCGYPGPDGQRRPTYPILAVRRMMERMAVLLAARRGEALIDAHQSLCMMTPTLSWCSGYWDGEQLTSSYTPGKKPLEYLPLETFRAEFMGRQFGVPAMFLNYAGRPFEPAQALAFSLIHDVLPRAHGPNQVQTLVTPIWRAFDAFDRSGARFVGYWDPALPVAAEPSSVKVSAWVRDDAVLLAASNLGDQPATASLAWRGASAGRRLTARDALTGAALPLDDGRITCVMPPLTYRLIEVRVAP